MRDISNLLYFYYYSKLGEISGKLYSAHCKKLEENPQLYKPFTLSEGALIRLASYACDGLSEPDVMERVNLDGDIVEAIKSKVASMVDFLIKVYNNMIDMRIHPDRNNSLVFATELLLYRIKETSSTVRYLCQKLIRYSNVIMRDDFIYVCLAVHNLDFFSYNIQECANDINSALLASCRSTNTMNIPVTKESKISSCRILEGMDSDKNRYLCDLKNKVVSDLVPLHESSIAELGRRYEYDMSLLFQSVMISIQDYGQSFSKGSRLVILSSGKISFINDFTNDSILYNRSIDYLAVGGLPIYRISSNMVLDDREAQDKITILSSSDDEELITPVRAVVSKGK
ncbi:hypothetical protein [Ehrlichia japonica]|uniref:Uncharacterized protein n=1 Tax=Ehrlichia japonica TaxID=391036 RepID=X5GL73_9RICK|nr:hypothetical protein [Ehrlichia japonica]AHX04896.1 hypothetical protein EHF_0224 [Ehrlichia japonica]